MTEITQTSQITKITKNTKIFKQSRISQSYQYNLQICAIILLINVYW